MMSTPQPDEIKQTVDQIAAALQETKTKLLFQIVEELGPEKARAFMEEALAVEAQGGMLTVDGSRRRTLGGIFFRLIKEQIPDEVRQRLFPPKDWRKMREKKRKARATAQAAEKSQKQNNVAATPAFSWEDRLPFATRLLDSGEPGRADTVKITLVGRPGRVIEQAGYVMTTMQSSGHVPTLPRGIPRPPESRLVYLVYLTQKQWQKVAHEVSRPHHVLIIEGHPTWDHALKRLVVLAKSVRAQETPPRAGQGERKPGIATTIKQVLVGKPGTVMELGQGLLVAMRGSGRAGTLPKGLPELPGNTLLHLVYLGGRQWRKIAEEMSAPDATLAVEGFPMYDAELKRMALFAVQLRAVERKAQHQAEPSHA